MCACVSEKERETYTEKQTERHRKRHREKDGETDTGRKMERHRQTDRQTHLCTTKQVAVSYQKEYGTHKKWPQKND